MGFDTLPLKLGTREETKVVPYSKFENTEVKAEASPQAIERRLRMVAEPNELCAALGKARLIVAEK